MKLIRLTIHNMASIGDAIIDFSAKPLADSEVFLSPEKPEPENPLYLTASVWLFSHLLQDSGIQESMVPHPTILPMNR